MTQTILCCTRCPAQADLNQNAASANGWQIVPKVICEDCIKAEIAARPTHQVVEQHAHYYGKVIATLQLIPIENGARS